MKMPLGKRKLRELIEDAWYDAPSASAGFGRIEAIIEQQIKADRKKYELEARIDELENRLRVQFIPSHWERLRSETNSWAKYVDRRIAELKQELEKL